MTDTPPPEGTPHKNATNKQKLEAALIMKRRELVASMVLRHMTTRAIADALFKQANMGAQDKDGVLIPHAHSTIARDIKAIRKEWRDSMVRDYDEHVSETVAEINEAARMAIGAGDVQAWLKAIGLRVKVQGLEAPTKIEIRDWREIARAEGLSDTDIAAIEKQAAELAS